MSKIQKPKLTKSNQSLDKAFQIIEAMAKASKPMRLQDIAASVDQPASTAIRFLNTLVQRGYVNQNPETNKYSLSIKFCQLGNLVSAQISIRDTIRPYLEELSLYCKESACLTIERNMQVVYIDVVEGPDSMLKALQRIGHVAPLHCTGVGKLFLLNYTVPQIDTFIKDKGLDYYTDHTITTKKDLLEELSLIKNTIYSMDNEECELGAKCVAAPIRDYTGEVIACISVTGPISRMTPDKIDLIREKILASAYELSSILGYDPSIA